MGTRINFRAHANKTRLQKFNFPCSTVGTGGSPLIPTSVRKESNGRKDVLLFLSNLFFRPIRFDRTRDRGFFEIPLVEIKISTRRCIFGRERERGGGGMGELGDFARIDRARVVAISTGIRGIIAAPSSFRLCAELRIYKMERFHAVFNERSSRKATISNREAPYVASCIRRSMVYASIVPCFFRTIDLILLAANRSFRDEVKSGIDRCELSAN